MNNKTVTVDVRDDIRTGREPFSKIMSAAAALRPDEQLLLIAPFEPVPLFHVMEKQGFGHTGYTTASGDWEILFTRESQNHSEPRSSRREEALSSVVTMHAKGDVSPLEPAGTEIVEVDARGLEPPQPLVKILETLAGLPAGAELRACTDRRPIHLYPQLRERGFAARTEEQPDGSFITHIRRS